MLFLEHMLLLQRLPATLLVNKAKFLARKEFESEYEHKQEPAASQNLLHPHTPFITCHLTEPNDFLHVEWKKDTDWRSSKSLCLSRIALALVWQDWFPEPVKIASKNKENLTTVNQVRKELNYHQYRNHKHINIITNINIYHPEFNDYENKLVNKKK
jgi:hypothetical protein